MKATIGLSLTMAMIVAGAAGCQNREPIGQGFGESVRHNMAAQIIDPRPRAGGAPDFSGARAADAVKRYEKGQVKELQIESTSKMRTK